jgi:hypothetical protein
VRFWDTSAIVPLLVVQNASRACLSLLAEDLGLVVWWGTRLECASALARLERVGASVQPARERLDVLATAWAEVEPTEPLRQTAMRLLRVHPLRAADALQLAAAVVWSEGAPDLPFVTLEERLADAADREGFHVIQPSATTHAQPADDP